MNFVMKLPVQWNVGKFLKAVQLAASEEGQLCGVS
jgi:hypothetical protein